MTVYKYNSIFAITILNSIIPLSKQLNSFLSEKMICSQYKKGDFIVKKGEVCDRVHIIRKGLVRGFFNYNSSEITTWVSIDNEFVTSISGFFKGKPAMENIECIEDTFTESLSFKDMEYAIRNYEDMSKLYRILLEDYYVQSEFRSFLGRIPNAKDRLQYFCENSNTEIYKRLPKKCLASLLNIRPETLSRLHLKVKEI